MFISTFWGGGGGIVFVSSTNVPRISSRPQDYQKNSDRKRLKNNVFDFSIISFSWIRPQIAS